MKEWRFKCIFSQITEYFVLFYFINVYILGKKNLNESLFVSFGESMKIIIIVKVGYLCIGQMMVWDNVVMSHFH
jgi:hypothetical protein